MRGEWCLVSVSFFFGVFNLVFALLLFFYFLFAAAASVAAIHKLVPGVVGIKIDICVYSCVQKNSCADRVLKKLFRY